MATLARLGRLVGKSACWAAKAGVAACAPRGLHLCAESGLARRSGWFKAMCGEGRGGTLPRRDPAAFRISHFALRISQFALRIRTSHFALRISNFAFRIPHHILFCINVLKLDV